MTDIRPQSTRFCLSCRYSLQGISSTKCPECSRAFDPNDPGTTATHPYRTGLQWLVPVCRAMVVFSGVVAGIGFIVSAMGIDPFLFALLAFFTAPVLLCTLVAAVLPFVPLSRRQRVLGLLFPVLLASIVWKQWPFSISFAMHRPAMGRLADQVQAGIPVKTPRQIGMFRLKSVRTLPNGNIGFQLTGDAGGGEYLVRRAPNTTWIWYNTNWEIALGDGWYRVYED